MNLVKKALLVIGVLSFGSVAAAPAFADQAYASGSSAIVLMNGASQSVGVEIAAPSGTAFDGQATGTGNVIVTPVLTTTLEVNANSFVTLEIEAGPVIDGPTSSSFTAAAAAALTAATTLEAEVSIIRAGAGADGLE